MFRKDGKIFFETREEGEQYIKNIGTKIDRAREEYFKALYEYAEGDSKTFVSYIQEHTPSEMKDANKWFVDKIREGMSL